MRTLPTRPESNTPAPDFERDLQIDHNALDVEFIEQPNKFFIYCREFAKASKRKREAEKAKLLRRAKLRKEASDANEKVTEGLLEERLADTPEYDEYIQAAFDVDLFEGGVKAMDGRKKSIEELLKLLNMQYFSGPREPRNLDNEISSRDRERGRQIGKAINNK